MSQNIIQMQNHYALGAMTGIVEVFLTQPIDNHKTRSQVVVHFGKKGHFVGMLHGLLESCLSERSLGNHSYYA